jgi:sirohydrochlorin ferrochelatase
VAIAPYLLAPGHFADRLAVAGADLVAEPLGAAPALVELVLDRASSLLVDACRSSTYG